MQHGYRIDVGGIMPYTSLAAPMSYVKPKDIKNAWDCIGYASKSITRQPTEHDQHLSHASSSGL